MRQGFSAGDDILHRTPAKHLTRVQRSLPMALFNRFLEIDVMTQAASLSFYALLSLAPLLVLLLWLTACCIHPRRKRWCSRSRNWPVAARRRWPIR